MSPVIVGLSCVPFFFLAYNSTYGYDQLEYLVIGRSLQDGYRFYDFIPSKSFGLYTFVALCFRAGLPHTRTAVAVLVTAVYALTVAGTYWAFRTRFSRMQATLACVLVAIAAVFTELNYLQPEPFVVLFGLLTFTIIAPPVDLSHRRIFLAGLALAFGFHFKSRALLLSI